MNGRNRIAVDCTSRRMISHKDLGMPDPTPSAANGLSADEFKFIQDAAEYLENPSFLMRLADMFGRPVGWLIKGIEKVSPEVVNKSANAALRAALSVAIATIP